jgi:hypothetical protein
MSTAEDHTYPEDQLGEGEGLVATLLAALSLDQLTEQIDYWRNERARSSTNLQRYHVGKCLSSALAEKSTRSGE